MAAGIPAGLTGEGGAPAGAALKAQREFGLLVGGVLCGAFGLLLPALRHHRLPVWPWALGVPLVALGALAPSVLRWPHRAWMALGGALGFVNTRIILGVIFFLIVTPFGVLLRVFGRDPMRRAKRPDTYRVPSEPTSPERMKEPF
jgi:hypothetical protein